MNLPQRTITNEKELDTWLAEARETLSKAIKDGPAII